MRKPAMKESEKLSKMLDKLDLTLKEGVAFARKQNLISHERIFLHILSHIQAMRDSLGS